MELGAQAKKRAINVELLQAPRKIAVKTQRAGSAPWGSASVLAIPFLLVVVSAGYFFGQPPLWVLGVYPALSALTFLAYALDKSAAQQGRWRTSENTLHLLALAGGWPGALVAQQVLRHKSSKAVFRAAFWCTVMFNLLAFVFLASPYGRSLTGV
ncbi:hypothetical protein D3C71_1558930 [compost metagenome]